MSSFVRSLNYCNLPPEGEYILPSDSNLIKLNKTSDNTIIKLNSRLWPSEGKIEF